MELVNHVNRGNVNHAIAIRQWPPIMPSSVQFLSCPNVEVQSRASGLISGRTDGYPKMGWQRGNQQSLDVWGTFFGSYACKTLI